jgi:hypothetical protein
MKDTRSIVLIGIVLAGFMGISTPREPGLTPQDKPAVGSPSLTEEVTSRFRDVVTEYFSQARIPGLAAAVVNDKGILWSTTLGVLAGDSSNRVDDRTLFSIQSMTKSFTALGVLLAVQEGWLNLDTRISDYLPDFRINSRFEKNPEKVITLRQADQKIGSTLGLLRIDVVKPYGLNFAGGGYGFFSFMAMYPDVKLGLVLLTNSRAVDFSADNFQFIDEIIMKHHGPNLNTPPPREDMTPLDNTDPRVRYRVGRYGPRSPEIGTQDGKLQINISGRSFPLEFFEFRGEMIGLFGNNMAVKFLPDLEEGRGPMMVYNLVFGNSNRDYYFFNDSPSDKPRPDKPEWDKYLGEYEAVYFGRRPFKETVQRRNGHLYWGEQKLTEYKPGLFFLFNGRALDFNQDPPRLGHFQIRPVKISSQPMKGRFRNSSSRASSGQPSATRIPGRGGSVGKSPSL